MYSQLTLPSHGSYRLKCCSSLNNFLVYQTKQTQLQLIQFSNLFQIKNSSIILVDDQSIKQIRLLLIESNIYIGVAYLTKMVIFNRSSVLTKFQLLLPCNIVDFSQTVVACTTSEHPPSFQFLTAASQLCTIPLSGPSTKYLLESLPRPCSMCTCSNQTLAVGCEDGLLFLYHKSKQIKSYLSQSKLPILYVQWVSDQFIVSCTCEGELLLFNAELNLLQKMPTHFGRMHLYSIKHCLYTVGDDAVVKKYIIHQSTPVMDCVQRKQYANKVNLIFSVGDKVFVNFYQNNKPMPVQ